MGSKGLFTYTTTIEPHKTVAEIQVELISHGAKSILLNYDKEQRIESISFMIDSPYGNMGIKLPCNPKPILEVLKRQHVAKKYLNEHHALRVAWRIILYWTKAQMAILDADMVKMEQIFLPYIVDKNGKTLYEKLADSRFQLTDGKKDK